MSQPHYIPSEQAARRLQKATELMDEIYAHRGKASMHRANMRLIEIQVDIAGMAIGDFLDAYFQKKYRQTPAAAALPPVVADAPVYQCAGCQKKFTNPKAYQGHGQSRCLQKQQAKDTNVG